MVSWLGAQLFACVAGGVLRLVYCSATAAMAVLAVSALLMLVPVYKRAQTGQGVAPPAPFQHVMSNKCCAVLCCAHEGSRWCGRVQIKGMKEYIARFGHGSAKLARQAQSKEKTLAKMVAEGLTEKVVKESAVQIKFENVGKLPPPVLQVCLQHKQTRVSACRCTRPLLLAPAACLLNACSQPDFGRVPPTLAPTSCSRPGCAHNVVPACVPLCSDLSMSSLGYVAKII